VSATPAEPATALSFFDADAGVHGTIRSSLTLLFEGREARAERGPAEIERTGDGWHARASGDVEVKLMPTADTADLGGIAVSVCSVEGRVGGKKITGLGTAAETHRPPEWRDLDLVRAVSAVFDPGLAALAVARRPRAEEGHGGELVNAALLEGGELRAPESARISTVYDGGGRQHSSGLELWFPGEEYPRRLFGTVQAGTSLELEGLWVHAAAFNWRMEGHAGAGLCELTLHRDEAEPAAA
jgi:hypothetical protein